MTQLAMTNGNPSVELVMAGSLLSSICMGVGMLRLEAQTRDGEVRSDDIVPLDMMREFSESKRAGEANVVFSMALNRLKGPDDTLTPEELSSLDYVSRRYVSLGEEEIEAFVAQCVEQASTLLGGAAQAKDALSGMSRESREAALALVAMVCDPSGSLRKGRLH